VRLYFLWKRDVMEFAGLDYAQVEALGVCISEVLAIRRDRTAQRAVFRRVVR
jgi:hypothetical protein